MKLLQNAKVRNKILTMGLVSIILTVLIGSISVFYLNNVNSNAKVMFLGFEKAIYIGDAMDAKDESDKMLLELMVTKDTKRNEELKKGIKDLEDDIKINIQTYEQLGLSEKEEQIVKEFYSALEQSQSVKDQIISFSASNQNEEAYALFMSQYKDASQQLEDQVDSLNSTLMELGKNMNQANAVEFRNALITDMAVIIVAILIMLFFVIAITKLIAKPIEAFSNYIAKFSDGDLSEETYLESNKFKIYKDEIGTLGNAISQMRSRLWEVVSKINDVATQVASSSQELSASTEESLSMIEETTSSVTSIAQGAEEQLQNTSFTLTRIESISKNVEHSNLSIEETVGMTKEASLAANGGEKAINETKKQMELIEQTVLQANEIILELGARSSEIGEIVETISSIAEQTNLLSLNAAIEAARAGEQGKGFAVVAEEVRKLAENSSLSASKVADLIQSIQKETSNAVSSIQDGTSQVRIGMTVVDQAKEAFHDISRLVDGMTVQVKEVADVSKEIQQGSEQILNSSKEIDTLSKEFSEVSTNIAASMEEQTATVNEIARASENLSAIGEDLVNEVATFQL